MTMLFIVMTIIVCSLPMRNWNPNTVYPVLGLREFVAYLWGIETCAHEAFSSKQKNMFVAYLWGIETWGSTTARYSAVVCSLPMRNWNCVVHGTMCDTSGFVAYLWGIETPIFTPSLNRNSVCSLPMRNWNRKPKRLRSQKLPFVAYLCGIETFWFRHFMSINLRL